MLSIGVIGGWGGDGRSAGYYTASVARGRDDYYTGKGEAPGEWFGAGAQTLGLAGEIDADEFHKVVMEAVDPTSGEQLRRLARDHPVHGVDMTFSAPRLLRTPTSDRCQALTLRWASRGVGCSHAVGRCVCKIASSVHGLTLTDGHRARADRQSGSSCCGRIAVRLLLRPSRSVPGSHGSSASSDPPRNRGPCGADSTARGHGVRGRRRGRRPPGAAGSPAGQDGRLQRRGSRRLAGRHAQGGGHERRVHRGQARGHRRQPWGAADRLIARVRRRHQRRLAAPLGRDLHTPVRGSEDAERGDRGARWRRCSPDRVHRPGQCTSGGGTDRDGARAQRIARSST